MRARLIFVVVAILLVAGFAALNWSEFMRPMPLNFGAQVVDAPLGAIMLGVFAVTLLVFLVSGAVHESRWLAESRRHAKTLQSQRDLAEKAEASRFTDLSHQLDSHLRESRHREAIAATELEKAMVQSQRELRNQLEVINRTLDARLGELEGRIGSRLERLQPPPPVDLPPRERVKL